MQILTIKDVKPKVESAIGDLLGTYTYPNGYTRKAISVGNPPRQVEVSGLEAILPMLPKTETVKWLTDSLYFCEYWSIYLIQREDCDNETFFDACTRLKHFYQCSNAKWIQAENDISYPQFVLTFKWEDIDKPYKPN